MQHAGAKGLGLFAVDKFLRGAVVAHMMKPKLITFPSSRQLDEWWRDYARAHYVPEDSAIFLSQSFSVCKRLVFDEVFSARHVPLWYRINHSRAPNVRPRFRLGALEFVAVSTVSPGDEIVFSYGEPDPSWQ